jgi:hypothetical protein
MRNVDHPSICGLVIHRAISIFETQMTLRISALALGILLLIGLPAFAKGSGSGSKHDPWDSHHIDNLPLEVRQYIASVCKGAPIAQHDFATYSPQEKRWRINLEYLRCSGLGEYRHAGQCLDVDFVASGTHYRLVRKTYAACGF